MIQQAVILASGRGTHLSRLTNERPESLLPVLGKPIVVRVMDRLREAGIRRFVVVIGEREGAVAAYLSSSWYPDIEVKFALQAVPTGSVDALTLAAHHIDGPFLLSSADNVTSVDHIRNLIQRFDQQDGEIATLSLIQANADSIRQAVGATIEGDRVVAVEEKPEQVNTPWLSFTLYALSRQMLDYLPQVKKSARGERELVGAIQASLNSGCRVGYTVAEWRLHLTTENDLLAVNKRFLTEGRDAHILSELPGSVHVTSPVRIDPKVSIGQNARIGPNVYLESGSTVGQGAVLRDCIVMSGATIPAHEQCSEQIVTRSERIAVKEKC